MKKQDYVTPKLTVIGTAADITATSNKVNGTNDAYAQLGLIGSIVAPR